MAKTKTAATKKAATKTKTVKAKAPKQVPFTDFADKKPKNGELVEFRDSLSERGIYNASEDAVYVNGTKRTPLQWRPVQNLSDVEASQAGAEQRKQETFDQLQVPKARRGENLHEQNPDLHTDIRRSQIAATVAENEAPAREQTLVGQAAREEEPDAEEEKTATLAEPGEGEFAEGTGETTSEEQKDK